MLMNQYQESFDMITNGKELAEKIPDFSLKFYSNTLLRGI